MVHRQVQLPVRRKGRLLSSMNMNVLASLPVPFAVSADVDLNLSISQPTEQSPKRDKSSLGLQLHHGSYEGSELKRPKEEYQQRQQRRREEVEVAIGSRGSSGGGRLRWSCELRRWAAAAVACNQN